MSRLHRDSTSHVYTLQFAERQMHSSSGPRLSCRARDRDTRWGMWYDRLGTAAVDISVRFVNPYVVTWAVAGGNVTDGLAHAYPCLAFGTPNVYSGVPATSV